MPNSGQVSTRNKSATKQRKKLKTKRGARHNWVGSGSGFVRSKDSKRGPISTLNELTQTYWQEVTPSEIRATEDGGLDIFLNIHVRPNSQVKTMSNLNKKRNVSKQKCAKTNRSRRRRKTKDGSSRSLSSHAESHSLNSWTGAITSAHKFASGLKRIIQNSQKAKKKKRSPSKAHHRRASSKKGVKCMHINLWNIENNNNHKE